MTSKTPTAKHQVAQHLDAALGVKFSDPTLRTALKTALALAQTPIRNRSYLEFENLLVGGKISCPSTKGLLMRRTKRAGCVWFFRYRNAENKETEYKMGLYRRDHDVGEGLTLSEARAEARLLEERRISGLPLDGGKSTLPTVKDLCERFIHEYSFGIRSDGEPVKRSGQEDARLLRRHIVPHYGNVLATEFRSDTIRKVLSSLSDRGAPREAQKLRAVISTMFNVACGRTSKISYPNGSWLPEDHHNPTDGALAPAHTTKSFCPSRDQLQAFTEGLQAAVYSTTLKLQLLTMTRVGEAAQAAWIEFDLDNALWNLPSARAKNKHGYTIQLSRQAVALLRSIKASQKSKGIETAYLFPAPQNQAKPINKANAIRDAARVRIAAGLPDGFSTHAMRHAGLTWLKESLCPLDVRNAITNHRTMSQDAKVDGGYTKAADFSLLSKKWLQKWADHIDGLMGENIVQMQRRPHSSKCKI